MTVLLTSPSICVTAPAGTGKTHLIIESVAAYSGTKPLLILTHTNAGVSVLRQRLAEARVEPKRCNISTIDGFALLLVRKFPLRAAYSVSVQEVDYPKVRSAALALLTGQHIDSLLVANYGRVIVDEYQDCDVVQHSIVSRLVELLPVAVLGDPLQQIFTFNEEMPTWKNVQKQFQAQDELNEPQRWLRAGSGPLGYWLLELREEIRQQKGVDLSTAPKQSLTHIKNEGKDAPYSNPMASISGMTGRILVVGDATSELRRWELARGFPGALVVETVELKCLVRFAEDIDAAIAGSISAVSRAQEVLLGFASSVMTKVNATTLLKRLASIQKGKNINPATAYEQAGLDLAASLTYRSVLAFLECLEAQKGVRLFRPSIFYAALKVLRMATAGQVCNLSIAVTEYREHRRHLIASIPTIAVGSTLLLKGLEADNVFINDADSMNANNLYVALTRGSRKVIVRSKSPTITPIISKPKHV